MPVLYALSQLGLVLYMFCVGLLTEIYYTLRDGAEFHDLGDQYFAQRDKPRVTNRLLKRLRDLGVNVEVKAA